MQNQSNTTNLKKNCVYLQAKKSVSFPMLLWRCYKDMQTYFGYFRHAWLYTTKMIVSTCRRLQCSSFTSLRYYFLKKHAILFADSIWAHNWRPTIVFIIFWDSLMFYQISLSPQVKQCTIITYKYGIYELPHEFPNEIRKY